MCILEVFFLRVLKEAMICIKTLQVLKCDQRGENMFPLPGVSPLERKGKQLPVMHDGRVISGKIPQQ